MPETCQRCGSSRIIPNVPLLDRSGEWTILEPSLVKVERNPDGWIGFLRDAAYGKVALRICGDCGFAELHVDNHRQLYEHYLRFLGQVPEADKLADETTCLSCGNVIPGGEPKCPACGWSWEVPETT